MVFEDSAMGTRWRIVIHGDDPARAARAAEAGFALIHRRDDLLSDWQPSSALSRLGREAWPDAVPVDPVLHDILVRASELSELTDGAFDVTVGPAVRLWRRARRQQELPRADRLADALARMGWQKIETVADDPPRVRLAVADMQLDLGGIAKGHTAAAALEVLREHGIEHALVDGGGDLALGAPPPDAGIWRIGVLPLREREDAAGRIVDLDRACGVATSGDAFRYVEIDGVRYSHIVDPRTGLGLVGRISATVIAPDPATADALASAVCVLGPEQGIRMLERLPGTEGLIAWRDGSADPLRSVRSSGFPEPHEPVRDRPGYPEVIDQ